MSRHTKKSHEYICLKCNSEHIQIKQVGSHTGVYCGQCGAWIKWVNKAELQKLYKRFDEENAGASKVFRKFIKRKDITIIKCSGCGCQLYNSNAPEPIGQFNLIGAKYCPKCGAELY